MRKQFTLGITLAAAIGGCGRTEQTEPPLTEPRLLGTWLSDADRTVDYQRQQGNLTAERETAMRKVYGYVRWTFDATRCRSELPADNGLGLRADVDDYAYEVLGRDAVSVVIRSIDSKALKSLQKIPTLKVSEFTLIHFDGEDAFWVLPDIGSQREFFKRERTAATRKSD